MAPPTAATPLVSPIRHCVVVRFIPDRACPEQGSHMRRRDFIAVLGATVPPSWPAGAWRHRRECLERWRPQSSTIHRWSASSIAHRPSPTDSIPMPFGRGWRKAGFVDGRSVRILRKRWAHGDYNALPALANELVAKGVVAIAATGDVASARAAQRASTTVPIVFTIGGDPVRFGLVAVSNRPGRHVHPGIAFLTEPARRQARAAAA